jgi:hypothetical protein
MCEKTEDTVKACWLELYCMIDEWTSSEIVREKKRSKAKKQIGVEDEIMWRWTLNGQYITQSAYQTNWKRSSPGFGRHKRNLNAEFLHESYYNIKSPLPTTWPSVDGCTTRYAHYVTQRRKRPHIMPRLPVHLKYVDAFDITYGKTEPTNIILTHYHCLVEMYVVLFWQKTETQIWRAHVIFGGTFGKNAT